MKTFDEIAAEQGWNADSREQILKDYIQTAPPLSLDEYAQQRAEEENGVEPGGKRVPDLQMDVTGEYQGNAYPEAGEYRIRIFPIDEEHFSLTIENSSGGIVGSMALGLDDIDGISKMATTDHDIDGYADDWKIPDGMVRTLVWVLPTDLDHEVVLSEGQIDEISNWFDYATGEKTWDWEEQGDVWEF